MEKQDVFVATGNGYILLEESFPGAHESHVPGHFLLYAEAGEVLDFSACQKKVWVCGTPYNTTANGDSSPQEVSGKKIQIIKWTAGAPEYFAVIKFQEITTKNEVKYYHYETGAEYTYDEIVENITAEELEHEGMSSAQELTDRYIYDDIFIEV